MVSAFAEENNLATIVGTKTPGRLLSGSAYMGIRNYNCWSQNLSWMPKLLRTAIKRS